MKGACWPRAHRLSGQPKTRGRVLQNTGEGSRIMFKLVDDLSAMPSLRSRTPIDG